MAWQLMSWGKKKKEPKALPEPVFGTLRIGNTFGFIYQIWFEKNQLAFKATFSTEIEGPLEGFADIFGQDGTLCYSGKELHKLGTKVKYSVWDVSIFVDLGEVTRESILEGMKK